MLAARNASDDDLENVFQTVDAWQKAAASLGARVEIVLVDWNSSRKRGGFRRFLKARGCHGELRAFEISEELHASFAQSGGQALIEHLAWNVGIRRANGDYVLVTRPGVMPTDALARFALVDALEPDTLYRTDLYEVERDADGEAKALAKVVRIHRTRETLDLKKHTSQLLFRRRFEVWAEAFILLIPRMVKHFLLLLHEARLSRKDGHSSPYRLLSKTWLVWRQDLRRVWYLFRLRRSTYLFFTPYHINVAGSFTLLSRRLWHELHGVPEYEGESTFVDAVFVQAALAKGRLKERILDWPKAVFGGNAAGESKSVLSADTAKLTPFEASKMAYALTQSDLPWNGHAWGLGELQLMEWSLGGN